MGKVGGGREEGEMGVGCTHCDEILSTAAIVVSGSGSHAADGTVTNESVGEGERAEKVKLVTLFV